VVSWLIALLRGRLRPHTLPASWRRPGPYRRDGQTRTPTSAPMRRCAALQPCIEPRGGRRPARPRRAAKHDDAFVYARGRHGWHGVLPQTRRRRRTGGATGLRHLAPGSTVSLGRPCGHAATPVASDHDGLGAKSEGRTVEPLTRPVARASGLTPSLARGGDRSNSRAFRTARWTPSRCARSWFACLSAGWRLALSYRGRWRGREVRVRGLAARSRLAASMVGFIARAPDRAVGWRAARVSRGGSG
jgi:hypothetical protein